MRIFSHQTRGAIAQILTFISDDAAKNFLYKHLGVSSVSFLYTLDDAPDEALRAMTTELLENNAFLRAAAPTKWVFERGIADLERWVLHDGWIVEKGAIVRVMPAAEEITGVRDKLIEDLSASGLDDDDAIKHGTVTATPGTR